MKNFYQHIKFKHNNQACLYLKQYSTENSKLAKQTEKLKFLLSCKTFAVIPKHIKNSSKISNMFNNTKNKKEAEKIENHFHNKVLKLEIKEANIRIKEIKTTQSHSERSIRQILSETEANDFFKIQRDSSQRLGEKIRETQKTKLDKLKNDMVEDFGFIYNEDWLVNNTNINLPEESKWLLSLGKKFALPVNTNNFSPINIIADLEQAVQTLTDETEKEIARTKIYKNIANHKNKITNTAKEKFILQTYQTTKRLLSEHKEKIIVTTADKGNKTVIMYKNEYTEKMNSLLEDRTVYKTIREDPTTKLQRKNNTIVNELLKQKQIDMKTKLKLYCSAALPPKLYGLPKIHKNNTPLRPISSSVDVPCYELAKYIGQILKNIISKERNIKNVDELKTRLENITLDHNEILISYDVVSLFTNIPIHLATKIIMKHWTTLENHTSITKTQFIKILDFCLNDNNYFVFNGQFYHQTYGMPMGSPLSPTIADIVLDDLLNSTTEQLEKDGIRIKSMVKYVDDFFAIIKTEDNPKILKKLNEYHPRLKFTYEVEDNNKLPFLDAVIHRKENHLIFDWYSKDIASGRIINFNSNHPKSQKINTANNLIKKILNISDAEFKDQNIEKIHTILRKNNYPVQITKDLLQKNIHSNNLNNTNTPSNTVSQPLKYFGAQYTPNLTENHRLNKIINQAHIKFAHRPTETINRLFTQTKDPTQKENKNSVVYQINCKGNNNQSCDKIYIGQTKRALKTRIAEHKEDTKKEKTTTALAQHMMTHKHQPDFDRVRILDTERNNNKRLTLESLRIQQNKENAMNTKEDIDNINSVYSLIL